MEFQGLCPGPGRAAGDSYLVQQLKHFEEGDVRGGKGSACSQLIMLQEDSGVLLQNDVP